MKVCFNGEIGDEQEFVRSVSPFSECIQLGKSVFETLRTYDGTRVFALDEHLDRLMESAQIFRFNLQSSNYKLQKGFVPFNKGDGPEYDLHFEKRDQGVLGTALKDFIKSCVLQLVEVNKQERQDLRIKIFLTEEFFWIRTTKLGEMPESFYREGIVVEETVFERNFPRVKYPNPAYHYLQSTRSKEAWETICFSPHGYLREGSITNVFAVFGKTIVTPYEGILLGVTREKVLETAKQLGFKTEEREIVREELLRADEIFLTCSTKEVVPVREIKNYKLKIKNGIVWENDNFEVAHKLREFFPRK